MPTKLQIDVAWRIRKGWRAVPLLRRVAAHAAAAEGFRDGSLSVAVVGARAMASLHERFMGLRRPTDVLSFDLGSDVTRGVLEAEVVLCSDVAVRNARSRGGTMTAARAELALYLVHGILHVGGYDDQTPRDFRRMHAREDVLLRQIGLGPVFHK